MAHYDPTKSWTENAMAGVDMTEPEQPIRIRIDEKDLARVVELLDSEGIEYEEL